MAASFVPTSDQRLLLRGPLLHDYVGHSTLYRPKSQLYARKVRSASHDGINTGKRALYYARHNPHPMKVRHMKGLWGTPICAVEDNLERQMIWSAPTGEQYSCQYTPRGSGRYSANVNKHIPAIGIVPITYTWKEELEKKAKNAITKALDKNKVHTNQVSRPHSAANDDNICSPAPYNAFDYFPDEKLIDLLCHILRTDSIPTVQSWLSAASDSEKAVVLNMLRMVASGEIDSNAVEPIQPHTPTKQARSASHHSHTATHHSYTWSNTHPATCDSVQYIWNPTSYDPQGQMDYEVSQAAGQLISTLPFLIPEQDTVIHSAHSLLASRQLRNTSRPPSAFHGSLQQELDKQASVLSARLKSSSKSNRSRHSHSSSSINYSTNQTNDMYPLRPLSREGRSLSNDLYPLRLVSREGRPLSNVSQE